jgi:hypothetical protein
VLASEIWDIFSTVSSVDFPACLSQSALGLYWVLGS